MSLRMRIIALGVAVFAVILATACQPREVYPRITDDSITTVGQLKGYVSTVGLGGSMGCFINGTYIDFAGSQTRFLNLEDRPLRTIEVTNPVSIEDLAKWGITESSFIFVQASDDADSNTFLSLISKLNRMKVRYSFAGPVEGRESKGIIIHLSQSKEGS